MVWSQISMNMLYDDFRKKWINREGLTLDQGAWWQILFALASAFISWKERVYSPVALYTYKATEYGTNIVKVKACFD